MWLSRVCYQKDIVGEYPEIWFRMRFCIMDDPIWYGLRVILIATIPEALQPKLFPSFKVSLEQSFSRIMHAHMLQRLRDFSSVQHMQLLPCQIYHPLSTCGICLIALSLMICVLKLQKVNFGCAYKQCGILFHKQTYKMCLTSYHVVLQHLL